MIYEQNDGTGGLATVLIIGYAAYALNFDSAEFMPISTGNAIRLGLLAFFLLVWVVITQALAKPTQDEQYVQRNRLAQTNISITWYNNATQAIKSMKTLVSVVAAAVVVVGIYTAFPHPASTMLEGSINNAWLYARSSYSHHNLFVYGTAMFFLVPYYVFGAIFLLCDIARPTWLQPFKVQDQSQQFTWAKFVQMSPLCLLNQVILFVFLEMFWSLFQIFSPDGFSEELPSLVTILINMLCFLPIADMCFYFPHRLMHENEWLFLHIHAVHHSFSAPIAFSAIYAHPVEFIIGNIPVVAMGPLLCGSHITTFWIWGFLASTQTTFAHSGWQFPILPGNQSHDYHHSTFVADDGAQNLGVLGVCDHLFGSDRGYAKSWKSKVSLAYATADYPVDKIVEAAAANNEKQSLPQKQNIVIKC